MTLLQSMEGKYYDIPEDEATSFEIPREKVKDLLAKAGPPATQGGPGPGQRPSGPMGGPPGGSPVVIQVLPNGVHGGAPAGGPPPSGPNGEVDPYWYQIWTNWTNYYIWTNYYY